MGFVAHIPSYTLGLGICGLGIWVSGAYPKVQSQVWDLWSWDLWGLGYAMQIPSQQKQLGICFLGSWDLAKAVTFGIWDLAYAPWGLAAVNTSRANLKSRMYLRFLLADPKFGFLGFGYWVLALGFGIWVLGIWVLGIWVFGILAT